jgi:hypothetical protein
MGNMSLKVFFGQTFIMVYSKFNNTIKQKKVHKGKQRHELFVSTLQHVLAYKPPAWIPFNTIRQYTKPAGHFIQYTYFFHFFSYC